MGRYLDPKNDLPFKRIFGEHPELLKSFLNALMPFAENQYIESLEYLPGEQVPDNPAKKNSIVDVRCRDSYGRQFIVEMQMYWSSAFSNRMVFNASKAYVRQLDVSEDYELLQPVYGLGILDEVFDRETPAYYHHYRTVNCRNSNEVIRGLEFVMIELPKFRPSSVAEKKMAVLWLRFLKEIEDSRYIEPAPELMENEYIRQAIEMCEVGAFTEAELYAYDRYWDVVRTEKSVRSASIREGKEQGIREGLEKGLVEGRMEGLAEGRKEGLAEGRKKEKENTAVNGFKNGLSIETVSSITGLSEDETVSILQKHGLMP
ncbi:MAG: Rpn family recombination-promoting nuclease/putative transposase [Tannerella sp.]|nr:Rpn family recombination-promoting nuclease/putative transposase [Tannerella sp.]